MQATPAFFKAPGGIQGSEKGAHTDTLLCLWVMKPFVSDPGVSGLPASHETAMAHLLDCIQIKSKIFYNSWQKTY